jgi:hypothetical protein
MKAKLLALWALAQPWLAKAYAWSPLAAGIVIGYCGHPIIKMALDALGNLIHLL